MGRIWKTLKAGALAILMSAVAPNAAYAAPTRPAPAQEETSCTKLETIAKREAAGMPTEYAKMSVATIKSLSADQAKYQCTVVKKNKDGTFNPTRSFDKFTLTDIPQDKNYQLIFLLNTVSYTNISQGHPPLSDDWIKYAVRANLGYHAKKLEADIRIDDKYIAISKYKNSRFQVKDGLSKWGAMQLADVYYSKAGLPPEKRLSGPCDDPAPKNYVCIPFYPEAIIPYALFQTEAPPKAPAARKEPQTKQPVKPKVGKKSEKKKKSRKLVGMVYGGGFGAFYHPISRTVPAQMFEFGYGTKNIMVGAFGQLVFGNDANEGNHHLEYFGGSFGIFFGVNFHRYAAWKIIAGPAIDRLKRKDEATLKQIYHKIFFGTELGTGFCLYYPLGGGAGMGGCVDYRLRIVDYAGSQLENIVGKTISPYVHGAILTMQARF